MNSKYVLMSSFVLVLGLLGAAWLVSNSKFSIRSIETSVTQDGMLTNSINVSGDGTSVTVPDLVIMSFTVQERDFSTKEAMRRTNEKMARVLEIVSANDVKEDKIKTTQLSITPRYDWTSEGSIFRGYDASQTLSVTMSYSKEDVKPTIVLDEVSSIQGLRIDSVSFDFENKKKLAEEARELAYKSAYEKASQLAKLSGVNLGKPISIVDQSSQFNKSNMMDVASTYRAVGLESSAPDTQIMAGELEHKISLQVVFAIE